jgi:cytochrome c oxidase assembly factor CtaG
VGRLQIGTRAEDAAFASAYGERCNRPKESSMKFTLRRLLATAGTVTLAACVVAGIVKHAKHGFAFYLGDVAWFTFLIGVLVTLALALAVLGKVARSRHDARVEVR